MSPRSKHRETNGRHLFYKTGHIATPVLEVQTAVNSEWNGLRTEPCGILILIADLEDHHYQRLGVCHSNMTLEVQAKDPCRCSDVVVLDKSLKTPNASRDFSQSSAE
ncbi:hypothetical protein EVAR_96229_1 [Eumeta japonica]|uniref:Uncharacterized protein n=1 Tax=Eumeta variegata TaxID=151549 RepID=A0A4C1WKT4_EUMVA|nr:hypothetical protein EVAR_96229_1 [Eumeta japonica]